MKRFDTSKYGSRILLIYAKSASVLHDFALQTRWLMDKCMNTKELVLPFATSTSTKIKMYNY